MQQSGWAKNLGSLALMLAIIGVAVVVGVTAFARWEWVAKIASVGGILNGGILLLLALILAVIALVISLFSKGSSKRPALIALGLSGGLLGLLYVMVSPGLSVPPLHDISTDLDNPPALQVLPLREDNLIPFATMDEWRAMHRTGYPDIAPITVAAPAAQVIAKAQELAENRGWTIAQVDAATGHMEATAYAGPMKFKDDVVIRAVQTEGSTRVDMRSISQVGLSDLGYNAARVEEFLGALQSEF